VGDNQSSLINGKKLVRVVVYHTTSKVDNSTTIVGCIPDSIPLANYYLIKTGKPQPISPILIE
jgi:hypothetical protein